MKHDDIALNIELSSDGQPPEWLPLIPAGFFSGRDGRQWTNDQPQRVIDYNRRLGRDIVIDFEHSSQVKATKGEPAPAAGWIKPEELDERDGAVWGRFDWNEPTKAALSRREYRYYSPAFFYDEHNRVTGIHSIGLTNRHNLFDLPALNQQEESAMSFLKVVSTALGLSDTATETEAIAAIHQLKTDKEKLALNADVAPDPNRFIPVETHQLALNRARDAESKLTEWQDTQRQRAAETLLDKAIEERKIAPANRAHFLALCRQEDGLEQVKKLLENAPAILAADTDLDHRNPTGNPLALNREQRQVADAFGNTAEDLDKYGKL